MMRLAGKTALVTGASRGIGRASALALAQAGAQVVVHYDRSEQAADAVVAEIRENGGHAKKVSADLRTPEGPYELARRVRGIVGARLDILVANAGIARTSGIEKTTVDDFDALFAVNVRAPYFLIQQLMPVMCKGSNVIVVSSLAARSAVGTMAAYAASKGALETLVRHFAMTLGARGIRVNAIAPGVVETEMSSFAKTDAGSADVLGMQVLQRLAQPDDISRALVFLASDAARWISGNTLRVDGGSKL